MISPSPATWSPTRSWRAASSSTCSAASVWCAFRTFTTAWLVLHYDVCVFCGECARGCATQEGITLSNEYELSGFSREAMVQTVEKEMVPCELCGKPIAAWDQFSPSG